MQVEALSSMTCTVVCTEVDDNTVKYGTYRSKTLLALGAFCFAEDLSDEGQEANDGEVICIDDSRCPALHDFELRAAMAPCFVAMMMPNSPPETAFYTDKRTQIMRLI